jgi:predicted methyltransferase
MGTDGADLLAELATATRLQEGPEGVRKILRSIFRLGPVPIRDLARDLGIPVPVVAAVRGELEKRKLATRESGVALTDAGVEALGAGSGIACKARYKVTSVLDLPELVLPLVSEFSDIAEHRPDVDVSLDQSHATAETAIRRAIYLFEHDAIEGRSLLFLGDDDLTSIAVGLLSKQLAIRPSRITVLDTDDRLVSFILKSAPAECPVETILHDLRHPIPTAILSQFDAFFTDPPYTTEGLELFSSRGVSAFRPEVGKLGFVSFGRKSPGDTVEIGRILASLGLGVVEVIPEFNRYEGAQLLAGSSQMIRVVFSGGATVGDSSYEGPLYTRDKRKPSRG